MRRNVSRMMVLLLATILTNLTFAQTAEQQRLIKRSYDMPKLEQIKRQLKTTSESQRTKARNIAAIKGWEILKYHTDGSMSELMDLTPEGNPIYFTTFNSTAAQSTRANHLNIGGSLGLSLDGQDMIAYVWDGGGTRETHQEFDGPGGTNRVTIMDGNTNISHHAQHVTGTIVASGVVAEAKGMAPRARARTYDWTNDLSEAASAAGDGMLLSNHSYGYAGRDRDTGEILLEGGMFGAYIEDSRDWDDLMYNSPYYLMVVAAGNDGSDDTMNSDPLESNGAFDKLTGHSVSKNNLVVANAQDANVNSDGDLISVVINPGSSEGPTDDYRIKPDIAGNGTDVYSPIGRNDSDYYSFDGTSMASPNVTGTLLLLQQHHSNETGGFMRAATLKGLALHTADDAGLSGPDAVFGWGLLNAKRAVETMDANGTNSVISELTLNPGETYTLEVASDGSSPLQASISWTDPAGPLQQVWNETTSKLVNDLDIRVSNDSDTYMPYMLTGVNSNGTGDNDVDPFERIDVTGASGTYTIEVTHEGALTNGSQNFTLIVTGVSVDDPGTGGEITYCETSSNDVSDEYISRVQLGTIDNSTGASSNGYGDYSHISTTLGLGSTNTITVTPTWTGQTYNEAYSVWIDYNQNGSFSDAGEQVWTQSPTQSTPVSGDFTVPADALEGSTRMRVSMRWNAIPGECEVLNYGEIEDYTVNIGEIQQPEDATVTLTITFDQFPGETTWQIVDGSSSIVHSGGPYGNSFQYATASGDYELPEGCYSFIMNDSYGDGICCDYGQGSYTLESNGITLVDSNGTFANSETTQFCLGGGLETNAAFAMQTTSQGIRTGYEIYPNPVAGSFLNVGTDREDVTYVITSISGQLIMSGDLSQSKIDVAKLKEGIYLIELTSEGKTQTKKFIKK